MSNQPAIDRNIERLAQFVRQSPNNGAAWLELGTALYDAARHAEAAPIFERAALLMPDNAVVRTYQGLIAQAFGDPDTAIAFYNQSLSLKSSDNRTRHNLAASLRDADRASDALTQVETAIANGSAYAETLTLRAHLLAELGQEDEAVAQYHDVLARHPTHLDAHETLARLLPQMGRTSEALNAYWPALNLLPHENTLWHSALRIANGLKDGEALKRLASEAEAAFGPRPEFLAARASAHGYANNHAEARDILTGLVANLPDDPALRIQLSHCFLCLHEPRLAEEHALEATRLSPLDQTAWSHLSIIWRMLDDAREAWLADYDKFVMVSLVDLPDGLADELNGLHWLTKHPAEQSLRGGTQTRGYLFSKRLPAIQSLGQAIIDSVVRQLARLPRNERHPFLGRNTGQVGFSGAWSVRLKSEGFHINHVHPEGWLSSALYVSLPSEIDHQSGALTFGVADAAFGLNLSPRRTEVPEKGKLVLFPSYFWHGTLPFESAGNRLTVAFDALPRP